VIFVNNPVSGLLILIAIFIQSRWLGTMSLLGTAAANRECDRTPANDKLMYLNTRPNWQIMTRTLKKSPLQIQIPNGIRGFGNAQFSVYMPLAWIRIPHRIALVA